MAETGEGWARGGLIVPEGGRPEEQGLWEAEGVRREKQLE